MLVGKRVRSCAALFGIAIAASPALAADYYGNTGNYGGYKDAPGAQPPAPPPPQPTWQGAYLGATFGWSWTTINAADNDVIITNKGSVPFAHPGTDGMIGGGVLGYNVQSGIFVYGIEGEFGGLETGASGSSIAQNPRRLISVTSSSGFYGDVVGRAGVVVGSSVLLYAKGGFAFATGNVHINDPHDGISQDSGTFTGWTFGGGVEFKLSHALSVKAEYQYFDVDNSNFSCCLPSTPGRLDDNITANTLKVGLNYYLNNLRSPLE